jgi:hypothetical protein
MMNATERKLRKIALILTVILALQFVWSGLRFWQTSEPDPIHPAESSLRVDDMRYGRDTEGDSAQALVNRPLFWQGRYPYVPDQVAEIEAPVMEVRGSTAIDQVKLRGVYPGGIIISYKGEGRRVRLSESVEDWTFIERLPGAAVFSSGKDSRTLNLEHAFSVAKPRAQPAVDESAADLKDVPATGNK